MKKLLVVVFIATMALAACSKKQDAPKDPANIARVSGHLYHTVSIAGKTWTAVNYNGPGGENYDTLPNDTLYGKLYTQAEAKAIVLPAGWRLPTQADFNTLLASVGCLGDAEGHYNTVDGSKPADLASTTGWTTTGGGNITGFNAMPAGYFTANSGDPLFMDRGSLAVFTTASTYPANDSWGSGAVRIVISPTSAGETSGVNRTDDRGSVRFVKDN
jgi:uncharacterized protein (TIGR02145 family)